MKKIFFSLVALAAIAACSKSEVEYTGQVEIGFAPVSKLGTKAAVDGTDYPDALNMFVFANAGLDGTDDNTTVEASECSEPYFKNAEFTHYPQRDPALTLSTDVFAGVIPYYWPNVKKLIFSGYSNSGNVATMNPKPTYEWDATAGTWEINISGYVPGAGSAVSGNNDLMWFPTTTSYGKPTTAGWSVPATMQHACAWVTININGDAVTGAATYPWLVTEVKFNHLVQEGNVNLGETAVWSITDPATPTADQKKPLEIFKNLDGKPLSVLTAVNGETTTGYTDYTKLSMTDLVVVPQTVKTLSVTYKFVSQKGATSAENIVISETKEIPLTYNTSGNNWEAGKHYIYNVIITTQEILVKPTVTDWTPDIYTNKEF